MLEAILFSVVLLESSYGKQMFLYWRKPMSFSPVYKGHHLEKFKMEIHIVNILFKKLLFPQVYHIYRYAVYLCLGKQKLFIKIEILNFIC